jgi:hypothetical protein
MVKKNYTIIFIALFFVINVQKNYNWKMHSRFLQLLLCLSIVFYCWKWVIFLIAFFERLKLIICKKRREWNKKGRKLFFSATWINLFSTKAKTTPNAFGKKKMEGRNIYTQYILMTWLYTNGTQKKKIAVKKRRRICGHENRKKKRM